MTARIANARYGHPAILLLSKHFTVAFAPTTTGTAISSPQRAPALAVDAASSEWHPQSDPQLSSFVEAAAEPVRKIGAFRRDTVWAKSSLGQDKSLVRGYARRVVGRLDAGEREMIELDPLPTSVLPAGVRARFVEGVNGLRMHVLETGAGTGGRPVVLLLHGFPELAFSWRHVMLPLAAAGFHVVAPDQRGYGRTTGADTTYDGDLASYRRLNLVRDAVGLVSALGVGSVAAVVGHDFGSPNAAWCGLVRPDIFRTVVLMSAPFGGTHSFPFERAADADPGTTLDEDLATLHPPRKQYGRYYRTLDAARDMQDPPQCVGAFLRAYYHYKSADWPGNRPHRLASGRASDMATMPTYYIMERDKGMAETVAAEMPSEAAIAANSWLPDDDLAVYAEEFGRTGFQGGLQWYRAGNIGATEMELFAGRTLDQPSMFIAGASDWGTYQSFGAFERMQTSACSDMQGAHLVPGAGHWVQQEQPGETADLLLSFLARNRIES